MTQTKVAMDRVECLDGGAGGQKCDMPIYKVDILAEVFFETYFQDLQFPRKYKLHFLFICSLTAI